MIIFLMAFDYDKTFTSAQAPGATILITFFHGIPAILMAYLFSFWAKTPASGFSVMTILGVISGLIATTAVWITLGENTCLRIFCNDYFGCNFWPYCNNGCVDYFG